MKRRVIALSLTIVLTFLCSCSLFSPSAQNTESVEPEVTAIPNDKTSQQVAFDLFTDDLFTKKVQTDSITLNYTLANPENYGITNFTPTFGEYSVEDMENNFKEDEQNLAKLNSFVYEDLTQDQQITYDILKELYTDDLKFKDYILYDEVLSSTTGLQAQLPVLLAEYNFNSKKDVTNYLLLLKDIDSYFNKICEFETKKSEAGLFMSDTTADEVIDQCNQFIQTPEKNLLIDIFSSKLDKFDYTEEEKKALIAENKEIVLNHVIPAYTHLVETLKGLKGTGKNTGGICNLENGKEYYSLLLKNQTGSSKTVEETKTALEAELTTSVQEMQSVISNDSKALDKVQDVKYKLTDPQEIINYLEKEIKKDFPKVHSVNCSIKYVDKSLEDHMSPAFYLTPPIDSYTNNSVYINKSQKYDLSDIFTTLAHEGYPGHLYQTVYYASTNPSLIRNIIDFGGYSEGWATYVEIYSYDLAGLDESVSKLLKLNQSSILCIYGLCDIGVNYTGWTEEELLTFLNSLGLGNADVAKEMYKAVIEEPCNYLKYTLGYVEMKQLNEKAKEALGKKFSLKDYHEFILNLGPAQYDIINKYLDQWIEEQKK
ncbi:MAG: DUF885 domain-containing protein [bacterium]|nr:DUF885 domain-containing protein [bacterium]